MSEDRPTLAELLRDEDAPLRHGRTCNPYDPEIGCECGLADWQAERDAEPTCWASGHQFCTHDEPTPCVHCGAVIDPALGEEPPTGEYHEGTAEDPRPPGDFDNVCDVCNYRDGLRGGR